MLRSMLWLGCWLLGWSIVVAAEPAPPEKPASDPRPAAPLPQDLDDPAAPLVEARPRSATEVDRIRAQALFAAAFTHEQREEYADALRLYQRALRYDPNSVSILRSIVQIALLKLDRRAEAMRYAVKLVERDPSNLGLLRQLGTQLREQGEFAGAERLLEKALELDQGDGALARRVLLKWELGRVYHRQGKTTEAAEMFADVLHALEQPQAVQLSDEQRRTIEEEDDLYETFGQVLLKAGKIDEAERAYRRAFPEGKPSLAGRLNFALAQVALARQETDAALQRLNSYLDAGHMSEGEEAYSLLAELFAARKEPDKLLPRLEELRGKQPDNRPLAGFLARQYQQAQRFDEAAPLVAQLLTGEPTTGALLQAIDFYHAAGRNEELLRTLASLVEATDDLDLLESRKLPLLRDVMATERVLELARTWRQDDPDQGTAAVRKAAAQLALLTSNFAAVEEFVPWAVEADPEAAAELYLGWGASLLGSDKAEDAVRVFRKAVDQQLLPEENPLFHYYLATALEASKRTDEALRVIDQAIAAAPAAPRLHGRRAWILYHARRFDDARAAYRQVIERFERQRGNSEAGRTVREARLTLSNIAVLQENFDEAEEWLEQILDEFPEDATANNDLAYVWSDRGKNLERALPMAERAVAAEPENRAFRDTLGWVYYRLGRFAEAVEQLEKAAAGEKTDGVVLDHLADAYFALGQKEKALATWKLALERFDETDAAKRQATVEKLKQHGGS